MPKMKVLGGEEIIKLFHSFGFEEIGQKGSHVKIRRMVSGTKQTLTVPMHKEIDKGLLKQIFIQASQYVSEEELRAYFYI